VESKVASYLAASGGGDADAMKAFEQATGRLSAVVLSADPKSSEQVQEISDASEIIQGNVVVH